MYSSEKQNTKNKKESVRSAGRADTEILDEAFHLQGSVGRYRFGSRMKDYNR